MPVVGGGAGLAGKRTVRDIDCAGRRVLMRVDFNVPLDGDRVVDPARVEGALPTLRYLLDQGARVALMSHLGRPKGRPVPSMSLRPVSLLLARLLGQPVAWAGDCVGEEAEAAVAALAPGQAVMLENVRFHPGDEANDPAMAAALARLGDIYVNDAFGAAHRAHASTSGVATYLPAVAGLLMERELDMLGGLLSSPARPFVVILGGAKVSDKFGVIESLLAKCDVLVVGGAMAHTFLAAQGASLGRSKLEAELAPEAGRLLAWAAAHGVQIILPTDLVAAAAPASEATVVVPATAVPPEYGAFDIGPDSTAAIAACIERAETVFWNGPLGMYELPQFARGTAGVAAAIVRAHARGAVTVAAGGDSLAVVAVGGLEDGFTHLSTGGGAALELLEGRELPGVACLLDKNGGPPH